MNLDDLLDRLVAEYSDQRHRGRAVDSAALLARAPEEHRAALERCFRMIDAGLAKGPTAPGLLGPGSSLAGFRIESVLGRGGMSVVYRAEQKELERPVALKVLRPGLALERQHVDRFHREALAVARINHPNIVQIHGVGEADGYHYIVMECIEGPSLATVLERMPTGRPPEAADLAQATGIEELKDCVSYERAVATLLAPVARAVGVAHDLGVVHRDIKPSNILIHRDGRAVVADFGLAKGEADLAVSLTGEPLGTPYYMSPEQVAQSSRGIDARTDVYSLGVTLYEALGGRRPYDGDTLFAIFDAIRGGEPRPLRQARSSCSRDSEAVVAQAMKHRPEDRYRSAMELASDLAALADGRPTQARAQLGGLLRGIGRFAVGALYSGPYEYKSPRTFLGWPLVHVNKGYPARPGELRLAKGWLAIGHVSIGAVSFGNVAMGGLTFGGISLGLLAWGGMSAGLLLAVGGLAVAGLLGIGGGAVGYVATGGMAWGYYAAGGMPYGRHVLSDRVVDPVAHQWFSDYLPWVIQLFQLSNGSS